MNQNGKVIERESDYGGSADPVQKPDPRRAARRKKGLPPLQKPNLPFADENKKVSYAPM